MDLPQLVLMPGMDGTGALLEPLLEALDETLSTRVLRYPLHEELDYEAQESRMRPELEGLGPHVLVAESFSGPLALRLANAQTRAVVLVASFLRAPVGARLEFFIRPSMFELRFHPTAVRAMMVGWEAPDELVERVVETVTKVDPGVLATRMRSVLRVDARPDLERLEAPLVLLHPEQDRVLFDWPLADFLELRPELDLRRIEGPHLLLQARPRICAELLLEVANRVG